MRLLLDAHISPRGVARPLRGCGHDVVAAAELERLDGATDEDLLEFAVTEDRILVTYDVKDLMHILARWTMEEGGHSGCIYVSPKTIRPNQFQMLVGAVTRLLEKFPEQHNWRDRIEWLKNE